MLFRKSGGVSLVLLLLIVGLAGIDVLAQTPPPIPTLPSGVPTLRPPPPFNPHLQTALDIGIISQLNQSQTRNGITVTLHRVYLDTTHIDITYSVSGMPFDLLKQMGKLRYFELQTAEGVRLPIITGGCGDNPNPGGISSVVCNVEIATHTDNAAGERVNYFDQFETMPETIALVMFVNLNGVPLPAPAPESTGELTPADGTATAASPTTVPTPTATTPPYGDAFRFDFTVPVYPTIILTPNQTVTAGGLTAALTEIAITPLYTSVTLCFEMPDTYDPMQDRWHTIGDNITFDGVAALTISLTGGLDPCQTINYVGYFDGTPTEIRYRVNSVQALTNVIMDETLWRDVQPLLEARGIVAELLISQGTVDYKITTLPEGVDFYHTINEILIELGYIEGFVGPWEFTIQYQSPTE